MWPFKKKQKKKEPKPKSYSFTVWETCNVGDWYFYDVEADNKKEAFVKLVKYFYGKEMNQPVKSDSRTISYPMTNRFGHTGMPLWFAKLISGGHGEYRCELQKFARENGIELKDEYL